MTIRVRSVLLALVAALVGSVLLAAPASAAEKVITITADGVTPKVLDVAKGDVITFVNEDSSFGYRAEATSDNWDLDSGPVGLLPGRSYTHPDPIEVAGTYTYRVAEGEPFQGAVRLPAPSPKPSAGGSPAAPKPSPQSPPSSPSPASSPTGGSGTAQPPVGGGLGTIQTDPSPAAGGVAPPPAIALPDLPGETAGPAPETAPEPDAGPTTASAIPGRLGSPPTARGYGLPAALAAVLAAGVASLLVRLLLAEPAARRRARGAMTGPAPVATID